MTIRMWWACTAVVAFVMGPRTASASPIQITSSDFDPSATIIHFASDLSSPSYPGLTFVGSAIQEPPSAWGPGSEPSFNTAIFALQTIDFASPVDQVGFYFGGNRANTVPFALLRGGVTLATYTLQSSPGVQNWNFFGFQDLGGIDQIIFSREATVGWEVGVGELEFANVSVSSAAPEPTSLLLLATGALGLVASRPRRRI